MRDDDLSSARHHQTRSKGSILTATLGAEHNEVREHISETTSRAASAAFHSAFGRRLAGKDHCDPGQIRPGSISSPDESDQLPRKNRKAPRRAGHHAQLEYDRKSRENSVGRLTAIVVGRLTRSLPRPSPFGLPVCVARVPARLRSVKRLGVWYRRPTG